MTRVILSDDCGNSPKNIFLTKITTAFAKGDSKFILGSVTDDIRWNIVGDKVIEGKDRFAEAMKQMKSDTKSNIDHVATRRQAPKWQQDSKTAKRDFVMCMNLVTRKVLHI
jgi:hypothetical protein